MKHIDFIGPAVRAKRFLKAALAKNKNSPPAGLVLSACVLFASCAGIQKEGAESPGAKAVYRSFVYSETKNLNSRGSLRMVFKFILLDFEGPPSLTKAAHAALYAGGDPAGYAERTAAAFAAQAGGGLDEQEGFTTEPVEWEYLEQFSVKSQSPRYLSICRERYYYTGGAHGNGEETFFVFDRAGERLLSLDDIVGKTNELPRLANEALRQAHGLAPAAPLTNAGFFENEVTEPGGFYLEDGILVLYWNRYEIAPYAMGTVEVKITRENLSGLLTPRGEELLTILR
jgi:hypothetical protein